MTLIEQRDTRYALLEAEFEHQVHKGDATELFVLERAGIERPPDLVVAVTGDDEDNVIICQLAREKYGVETVIARVNDPRNQPLLRPARHLADGVGHRVDHGPDRARGARARADHLLELRKENLEIVELTVGRGALCAGQEIAGRAAPRLAADLVVRDGKAEVPDDSMRLEEGDSVLAILEPGKEDELRRVLVQRLAARTGAVVAAARDPHRSRVLWPLERRLPLAALVRSAPPCCWCRPRPPARMPTAASSSASAASRRPST